TAAATGSASAAAAATISASPTASSAVPRTIMRTIMTFTGMDGFAVSVFTIEVGLAGLVFVEVATTFDRDGFFRLRPLRPRCFTAFRSGSAFAIAAARGRHLGALLFENGFAGQLDAIAFDAQDLHQHLVAFLQFVTDFAHAMFGDLADVQQAIGSGNDFDEGA